MNSGAKVNNISIVCAAGGIVFSPKGLILMMLRRGMWDLPKGHVEPDESLRACAAREVCEECGLDGAQLAVGEMITETVHVSAPGEEKHTSWFRMLYGGDPAKIRPQTEEDIEILRWVTPDEARELAATSYPTILHIINSII